MATSKIILYTVGYDYRKNVWLDDIEDYLDDLTPIKTWNTANYVKQGLDITIKVDLSQTDINSSRINLVSIKNSNDSRTFYYNVVKKRWTSESAVELVLSCDTLDTFNDLIIFSDKTKIHRQHYDRFVRNSRVTTAAFYATPIYDRHAENLNLTKRINFYQELGIETVYGSDKWYLIYCTNQQNVSSTTENQAVNCYIVPENDFTYTYTGVSHTLATLLPTSKYGYIIYRDGESITIGSNTYTANGTYAYIISRIDNYFQSNGTYQVKQINKSSGSLTTPWTSDNGTTAVTVNSNVVCDYRRVWNNTGSISGGIYDPRDFLGGLEDDDITFYLNTTLQYDATINASSVTYTLPGIETVDRTLSYLIKIIECPYCPIDFDVLNDIGTIVSTDELNSTNMLAIKLTDLTYNFNRELNIDRCANLDEYYIPGISSRFTTLKSANYEPKLTTSEISLKKLQYDSFEHDIALENLIYSGAGTNETSQIPFKIRYVQSNNLTSNLYFKLNFTNFRNEDQSITADVMISNRNNEYPIFNSSYLNYIRTGYNYDVKAKNLSRNQSLANMGISAIGSALGIGIGKSNKAGNLGSLYGLTQGVSLATGLIQNTSNIIFQDIAAKNQIAAKKAEAKAQQVSVSGSDNLNLLNNYLSNKLYLVNYAPTEEVLNSCFNLFFLTGYASDETGVPNLNTRWRFNYIECDAEFTTEYSPEWQDYLDDVKDRFSKGVTKFHHYDDFEQTLENFEYWLMV